MIEWWSSAHDIFIANKLSRNDIKDMVSQVPVIFRPLLKETLEIVHLRKIPFLILSAGLADVIEEILKSSG